MWLTAFTLALAAQQIPLEWTCRPFDYGSGNGCDCGCGIPDPDCPVVLADDGVTDIVDVTACVSNGCGVDQVPQSQDATRCVLNICGDGYRGGLETCDDGELPVDDDACTSDCAAIRSGWRCSEQGAGCREEGCGDFVVDLSGRREQCDDGNFLPGDGCNEQCLTEPGFVCFTFQPCQRTTCGNGSIEFDFDTRTGERCDDGNDVAGDGCDQCVIEPGFICDLFGVGCLQLVCGNGSLERGTLGEGEECDDGNTGDGDGCDAQCIVEDGWFCDSGFCVPLACGDGEVNPGPEFCDDGNELNDDGCSEDCSPETGFSCPVEGGACTRVVCGDGLVQSDNLSTIVEQCDDGNTTPEDGCDASCLVEPGFVCLPDQSCRRIVCGDGFVDGVAVGGPEACDDGNDSNGDGCDATCAFIEDGYLCDVPGEPCVRPVCGDGIRARIEQCDDANTAGGDGCSDVCEREDGYVCFEEGEPCVPVPEAWRCSRFVFGAGDGCDCGCGAPDPDCPADATIDACDFSGCLADAQYIDADDITACTTTPPPGEGEGEGEGGGAGDGEGAGDEGGCAQGSTSTSLAVLTLLAVVRMRRRSRAA